ncbi:MAG: hypothetical protein QG596_50 [Actinomycetota bacterium]|jgi:hypothetical protein|nr:hypothetical protein [Actinomycetota bacterium]
MKGTVSLTASEAIIEGTPVIFEITPRGPISEAVIEHLSEPGGSDLISIHSQQILAAATDPGSGDFQLTQYLLHELDYRSIPGIGDSWEEDVEIFELRNFLDAAFLGSLETAVGGFEPVIPGAVGDELFRLEREDEGPGLSRYLEFSADVHQFREFMVHRSLYQLKEADPHTWAIPRLAGKPKAALVEVQTDEYGGGDPERMHSRLFASAMEGVGLDSSENAYLDRIPAPTLATVNLMSALGKKRSRRGAITGHLAMFEMSSAIPNRSYGNGLRRLGFDEPVTRFFDEHVEADSVHENIAAYDLAQGLAMLEPELTSDIQFGARALILLEQRLAVHLLGCWEQDRTSLLS